MMRVFMNAIELKAWLNGFNEALNGSPPSAEQWALVVKMVGELRIFQELSIAAPIQRESIPFTSIPPVYPNLAPSSPMLPDEFKPRIWCQSESGQGGQIATIGACENGIN